MYIVEYYERPNGQQPALEWLDNQDKKVAANIEAKLQMLKSEGLRLLNTKVLKPIRGQSNLYEVIYSSFRLMTYFHEEQRVFWMLHGFRKQRQRESAEINRGTELMEECKRFLEGGTNGQEV